MKKLRILVPHSDHHQTITYKRLKKADTHTKSYTVFARFHNNKLFTSFCWNKLSIYN